MISRRTGLAATAAALLAGASGPAATAAAPHRAPGLRSRLQSDVDAIRATGATGVLAEVQSAHGRTTARAGSADLRAPRHPVPWNAYYRLGSDTKTFTATLALQLAGEGRLRLTDTPSSGGCPAPCGATATTAAGSRSPICCARPAA
ncbi:serine hydrolase [Streptomyces sp. NPDC059970]|uniref:serine hydrolase n=1 Tax=Streptomyces sp. NPDC059970 TaxID=3347019 RepID=UPI00367E81CF